MSIQFTVSLVGWSFAPFTLLEGAKTHAALPTQGLALDFIPVALRRRCSPFSKVTLAVAHAALKNYQGKGSVPTVFASMHGEGEVTKGLLVDLAHQQQLSPMGFSLSVHNTASGLYSIATGNKAASTAIAAGDDTFLMGLCEALMILHQGIADHVLYVCSDEEVPAIFLPPDVSGGMPHALALLLAKGEQASACCLSIEVLQGDKGSRCEEMPQAITCAQWLHGGLERKTFSSIGGEWSLSRRGEPASVLFVSPMSSST